MDRGDCSIEGDGEMKWYLVPLFMIFLTSCFNPRVHRGDILFRSATSDSLSSAINRVTGAVGYSHIGVVDTLHGKMVVIHATPHGGVIKSTLDEFSKEGGVARRVDVFMIRKPKEIRINTALRHANNLLGEKYNKTYIIEDSGYYCSEFIYDIFKEDSLFQLNPMTFKDPVSGTFNEGWVEYYKKLGIDIPEGKLGCNPNEMSKNCNLRYVFSYGESK
ncbi:hypothetical protein K4L44_07555 [Halosquirtibacter laminarini]|uniref:Uncharacterized protein n=1 Tax=Halosquirtibacter laminarini TaxID=3374600 RepID=A0AC61NIW4_9BACT|nr:hypothetical protein K4L44_07555 [Prolixibacteraceae bacterium]